jgi:hypothetical protein
LCQRRVQQRAAAAAWQQWLQVALQQAHAAQLGHRLLLLLEQLVWPLLLPHHHHRCVVASQARARACGHHWQH